MVLGCLGAVEVLLVTALCEGGYRCGFALCGVWLWSACLRSVRLLPFAGFGRRDRAKISKMVFPAASIYLTEVEGTDESD